MNDYMIALLERFRIETPELFARRARVHAAEDKLKDTLDDGQAEHRGHSAGKADAAGSAEVL